MTSPEPFDYQRYLRSKRSVEARCLNSHVWSALADYVTGLGHRPVRILELGGGVGSMALRFLEKFLHPNVDYTIVDASIPSLAAARAELLPHNRGWTFDFGSADIYDYLGQHASERWDLLVCHALLDLLDLDTALPRFLACLLPGGAFYFPISYDGLTIFEPEGNADFERELFAAYHRSMDQRRVGGQPPGDSRTGRHLLSALPAAGAQVVAAGASDWVVIPQAGAYPADEAYFLACILQTIEEELSGSENLDQPRLRDWLALRRAQLGRAELSFIAHQIDIFGVVPRVE